MVTDATYYIFESGSSVRPGRRMTHFVVRTWRGGGLPGGDDDVPPPVWDPEYGRHFWDRRPRRTLAWEKTLLHSYSQARAEAEEHARSLGLSIEWCGLPLDHIPESSLSNERLIEYGKGTPPPSK